MSLVVSIRVVGNLERLVSELTYVGLCVYRDAKFCSVTPSLASVCLFDEKCIFVDGRTVDVQYSNWEKRSVDVVNRSCVIITRNNYWNAFHCTQQQRFVCQS